MFLIEQSPDYKHYKYLNIMCQWQKGVCFWKINHKRKSVSSKSNFAHFFFFSSKIWRWSIRKFYFVRRVWLLIWVFIKIQKVKIGENLLHQKTSSLNFFVVIKVYKVNYWEQFTQGHVSWFFILIKTGKMKYKRNWLVKNHVFQLLFTCRFES